MSAYLPKNLSGIVNEAPTNVGQGVSTIFTFTFAGANLSTNSSVIVSPVVNMNAGVRLQWVRVVNTTTIAMGIRSNAGNINFSSTDDISFKFTVFEF